MEIRVGPVELGLIKDWTCVKGRVLSQSRNFRETKKLLYISQLVIRGVKTYDTLSDVSVNVNLVR